MQIDVKIHNFLKINFHAYSFDQHTIMKVTMQNKVPIKVSAQLTSPSVFLKYTQKNRTVKIAKNIFFSHHIVFYL